MLKLLGSKLRKEIANLQKIQVMRSPDYPDRKRNWEIYIYFPPEAVETWGLELMYNLIGEKILLTISLYDR